MIGAMIGDVVGSVYEFHNIKTKEFPLLSPRSIFTDDTLMSLAVADALLGLKEGKDFRKVLIHSMQGIAEEYPCPMGGYGERFYWWLQETDPQPYNSYGNGSAMRVSPCGEYAKTLEEALRLAKESAEVSHNHPEGIKGAQATAAAVWMAKHGATKQEIRDYITAHFYPLDQTVDQIRPAYDFDISCQGTVPPAIVCFLESDSFEDALRNAISLGGDSDTLADITCAIAWPFYARQGEDETMNMLRQRMMELLPPYLREIMEEWEKIFGQPA